MSAKFIKSKYTEMLLSTVVFVLIGVYCFLCSLFGADFACLHLNFFSREMPLFIGEMVFGVCLALTLMEIGWTFKENRIDLWMVVYFCGVVFLALWGYWHGGVLAFRNAAMLYYVLFGWMAYRCYSRNLFSFSPVLFSLLILFLFILLSIKFNYFFFWFTYLILFNVLAIKTNKKWLMGVGILLCIYQISFLFIESRSHFVAAILSFVFLAFVLGRSFLGISKAKIALILTVIVVLGFFIFGDRNQVRSLIFINELLERYKEKQSIIDANRDNYSPQDLKVKLYRTEDIMPRNDILSSGGALLKAQGLGVKQEIHNEQTPSKVTVAAPASTITKEKVPVTAYHQKAPAALKVEPLHTNAPTIQKNVVTPRESKTSVTTIVPKNVVTPRESKTSVTTIVPKNVVTSPESKTPVATIVAKPIAQPQVVSSNPSVENHIEQKSFRNIDLAYNNILFRYFIWRDMIEEWIRSDFFFGVGLGRPQRSPSIEMLGWACGEWTGVGWITPHNYFLHLIYRLGLIGIGLIVILIGGFVKLTKIFISYKDVVGLLLMGAILYWIILAQFLVVMELPYYAILFWSLFGMTFAYAQDLKAKKTSQA